jgi:HAD superfamily hydrolase (TIGR01509 family)
VLKGVIFDMDGVLVDSHPVHMRAWRRCLASIGKTVSEQEMEFILEGRRREEILRRFLGELSDDQIQNYGQQKEELFREESKTIGTIPGVREFLDDLETALIPMAVASCGGRRRVHYLLNRLELRQYFSVIVTGDDVAEGKPAPAIFQKTAAVLKIPAKDLLVVEDSVSGVHAAKAAGMKCLGIAAPPRSPALFDAGVDFVLPDFLRPFASEIERILS